GPHAVAAEHRAVEIGIDALARLRLRRKHLPLVTAVPLERLAVAAIFLPGVEQTEMPAGPFHFLDRAAVALAARLEHGTDRPRLGVIARRRHAVGPPDPAVVPALDREQLSALPPVLGNREQDAARVVGGAPARHLDDLQPASELFVADDLSLADRKRATGLLEGRFDERARQHRLAGDGTAC